jgi:hypothetical protein
LDDKKADRCSPAMFLSFASALRRGMIASGVMVLEPPTPPALPAAMREHTRQAAEVSRAHGETLVFRIEQRCAATGRRRL